MTESEPCVTLVTHLQLGSNKLASFSKKPWG